jgi:hypothetical protein
MTRTITVTKQVHIVCYRPLKDVGVRVAPYDTAAAVLEKAGLEANDYMLMRPGDQADYGPTDLPFKDCPDGGKLHCMPNRAA